MVLSPPLFDWAGQLDKNVTTPTVSLPFPTTPVSIQKSLFSNLHQLIGSFLWSNKQARVGQAALRLPKSLGGSTLPDFCYYYWACNINKLLFWNTGKAVPEFPQWALLEISSSRSSLWSVVCSQLPLLVKQVSPNPIVMNTLMIWNQFRKTFDLHIQSGLQFS